jgi:hypothetical protein
VSPTVAKKYGTLIAFFLLLLSCRKEEKATESRLFQHVPPSVTGIEFINRLEESDDFNIIEYLYFYNGAGVAIGDVNNDGLSDIYFTGNQQPGKLYLNKGDFRFEDVTDRAGVSGTGNWKTGVTMADVNGDGFLDIFVCGVGNYKDFRGRNQLFVNNGDLTFTDRTDEFGLSFQGFSTQAAFFDYDNDGDLDMYLLNHAVHTSRSSGDIWLRFQSDPLAGDKLYRNDLIPGGKTNFREVTSGAGILSSQIGYGLGVSVSDVNQDGLMDIYVANDFHENDYLYINQGDGTFAQQLEKAVGHSSRFSMGTDIADINNDSRPDIITLDMLPKDEAVIKTTAGEDPYEIFQFKLRSGFHYQFARNALQLNRGKTADGTPLFSEIASLAGVEATDWSWAALLADFDNDGYKDIFITNGIERRPNDLDYINYINDDSIQQFAGDKSLIERMPYGRVKNVFYRNRGDLTFEDVSESWIDSAPSLSNGAAYADLDNDGDLDLVVNNINEEAYVLRNSDASDSSQYLSLNLAGNTANRFGIGAKVFVWSGGREFFQEVSPVRGWLSSVDYKVHFGLGNARQADSVLVVWPDLKYQLLTAVNAGRPLTLDQADAAGNWRTDMEQPKPEPDLTRLEDLPWRHRENSFVAFNVERLIPHMVSTQGPLISVGDINGDRLDDFYIGGAAGQPGSVFLQQKGKFSKSDQLSLSLDSLSEDAGSALFDANGDGALDLVVVSAGQELRGREPELQPRLYLNDGTGKLRREVQNMPPIFVNASCVKPADIDNDGDLDLFIGGRVIAGEYGKDPPSFFLINDGKGRFSDATSRLFPDGSGGATTPGMVTDAVWVNLNEDDKPDLIAVGEWMAVTVLIQTDSGTFVDQTEKYGLGKTNGWWNTVCADDFDGDGDTDLVVGNLGLNSRLRASRVNPVGLFVGDIDGNGSPDQILTYFNEGEQYPCVSRDQLVKQVPSLKRKFLRYSDYANVRLEDIIEQDNPDHIQKQVYMFESVYLENREGHFLITPLPAGAQMFPVFAFCSEDVNKDGNTDILAVGNLNAVQPDFARYDAGYGLVMYGDGKGNFREDHSFASGFVATGEGRDIKTLRTADGRTLILVSRNNDTLECFGIK